MRRTSLRLAAVATTLSALPVLAGCGLGTAGGYVPTAELAGPLSDTDSLDGATIAVGSKNFSESVLLGKIALILLKADGADVTDLTNIPGSASARQAALEDEIDLQWEYTGTGWITYLGHDKPIKDEHEQYTAVRDEDLAKNDLVWLPPAPMNNTYGFAVTKQVQEKFGVQSLSDIKDVPVAERTFCTESEFANRPDGLNGMLKTYGIPKGSPQGVPEKNLQIYQTGAIYDATAQGRCNFGEVFTTDGRIVALDLQVLKDDKQYFPNYNVSVVASKDVMDAYPQIADLVAPVTDELTNDVLLKLNAQIDVDGREPADVAHEWLQEEGFIA
ncbi:MAG: glycine betaine ABC transporter substrate-binding protein [Nocardioides sp.]|nr:glycine betaine ABC transporter substrate-binding protein [Nocardioides sp.]